MATIRPMAVAISASEIPADTPVRPPDAPAETEFNLPNFDCAARLVFVDGRFAPGLSTRLTEGEGLRVESLRTALESAENGVPSWLGRCADFESRGLAALNTAVAADGALVVLDDGAALQQWRASGFGEGGDGGAVDQQPAGGVVRANHHRPFGVRDDEQQGEALGGLVPWGAKEEGATPLARPLVQRNGVRCHVSP